MTEYNIIFNVSRPAAYNASSRSSLCFDETFKCRSDLYTRVSNAGSDTIQYEAAFSSLDD